METTPRPKWVGPTLELVWPAYFSMLFATFASGLLAAAILQLLGRGDTFDGDLVVVGGGGIGFGPNTPLFGFVGGLFSLAMAVGILSWGIEVVFEVPPVLERSNADWKTRRLIDEREAAARSVAWPIGFLIVFLVGIWTWMLVQGLVLPYAKTAVGTGLGAAAWIAIAGWLPVLLFSKTLQSIDRRRWF